MTEDEYRPVMPFVAVTSVGGPYDDEPYVAGYELGILDGQLSGGKPPTPERPGPPGINDWRWIQKANADQADLIAMKHGRRVTKTETLTKIIEATRYDTDYGQDAGTWWIAEYGPITEQDITDLDTEYEAYGDRLIARLEAEGLAEIVPARDWERVGEVANLVALEG